MTERLAKSLVTLRRQINEARQNRDKASDGWLGDRAHRKRKSDHNPNGLGVVTAIDVDEDLSPGEHAMSLVQALQASGDPRIKYIIYEGKITQKNNIKEWKKYTGVNPHNHHFHLSVSSDRGRYDDATEWDLSKWTPDSHAMEPGSPPVASQPELKRGAQGEAVRRLQRALRAHGELIEVDGDFGPGTEKAVKSFQAVKGLREDGIAGRNTNASLGLL